MFINSLRNRDLLSIADLSRDELKSLIELSFKLKELYYNGVRYLNVLNGKVVALIFEKHSTRTRVSLQVAIHQLGGHSLYLSSQELQLARGEPVKDTARVLERYVDGIAARVYSHKSLMELADYAKIPVINALSDVEHPLQALADVMTILEFKKNLKNVKIVFVGDGRDNVAHSLMLAVAMLGGTIFIATPQGYEPEPRLYNLARDYANESGGYVAIVRDPIEAVSNADVIYTDVWISMGQESERDKRVKDLRPYQVNKQLVSYAKKDYIFMHCLPAHRNEEVTEDVIESPNSVVWQQAENRLHTSKAVFASILG
ncbi:ornithine carbamoyltransferase [Ignisphaera sp. 4213-co]|uniref:Ornithine carbamoyltransferase n=1 Tax=Ignisphaera cupida TaxID=3050454 RepID=A0ABD4Z3A7_9CREN|nr:ornithine carbamoyltransferase [Ignisphaera sp. 4213-co]MDK6027801.1 ornithine carbamoyltransferase [Ignisphaera sp. 4213-co]